MRRVVALSAAAALAACARAPRLPAPIPPAAAEVRVVHALRVADLVTGTGEVAVDGRCHYVHYTGWLAATGAKFDSSRDPQPDGRPRAPLAFALGARALIPGWDAGGVQGMRVGGTRRLLIPWQMAYGERGREPRIPAKADLVFDVELLAIRDTLPRTADEGPPRRRQDFLPRCAPWRAGEMP
ncbi:MAG: FKBP-type peptidyl-prolyl cis-trans isomerase [Gemmatimonadaceae bacterium]|jgi:peptidylprolyl isomerase|nr:FKBP-type peptidyl-prolyl cis-trans isomerase [Gemmatimonadaceae bacterium]